jgi:hypothetical protein
VGGDGGKAVTRRERGRVGRVGGGMGLWLQVAVGKARLLTRRWELVRHGRGGVLPHINPALWPLHSSQRRHQSIHQTLPAHRWQRLRLLTAEDRGGVQQDRRGQGRRSLLLLWLL